jgi:hypothetical protein
MDHVLKTIDLAVSKVAPEIVLVLMLFMTAAALWGLLKEGKGPKTPFVVTIGGGAGAMVGAYLMTRFPLEGNLPEVGAFGAVLMIASIICIIVGVAKVTQSSDI